MAPVLSWLARARVPLGFLCAVVAYAFAEPSLHAVAIGAIVASPGALLRVWAAGHIIKGREITRSGPYRFLRHPLYVGSTILGIGFIVAARSPWSAAVVVVYLGVTLLAAVRTEEATLDARFAGQYASYRAGTAAAVERPFSVARVLANREYRALAGFALAMGLLLLRMRM